MTEDSKSNFDNNKHQSSKDNEQDQSEIFKSDIQNLQKEFKSILNEHSVKINQNYIIKLTKDVKNLKKEAKESCKVLHFSSEIAIDEILTKLAVINPAEYKNLFIFIIDVNNLEFLNETTAKIKEQLLKFGNFRPIILQISSEDANLAKFYHKEETLTDFNSIEIQQKNFEDLKDFPAFLCSFLNGNWGDTEEFELKMIDILPHVQQCSQILRFLRALDLSEEFFGSMILEISKKGSICDFLAALDASFESNGRMLSRRAQNYLSSLFHEDQQDDESSHDPGQEQNNAADPADNTQNDNDDPQVEASNNSHMSPSLLLIAVQNQNMEVINYLISYWTHLIQQLPFKHQIRISAAAFESKQFKVLCDLIEISDFPFPENFQTESVEYEHLSKITTKRNQLSSWILEENFVKIDEFIDNNSNLRIAYNPANISALNQCVKLKLLNIYFYLKSSGFRASEFGDLQEILSENELIQANKFKMQQRRRNVNEALQDPKNSIHLMLTRSSIHNKRIDKRQEAEYRQKIRKWFEDIKNIKFGTEFLEVVASCDKLRIIFDFESDTVENASLSGPYTLGSTYPISKWIFIGAKLTGDSNREQKIKGVLAHELCHYVMRLVYENQENPYYKHTIKVIETFKEIVKIIDKWSPNEAECPDDECNGIISSVFTLYSSDGFHLELIVRVVQILVEFDNEEDKIKYLQDKYKVLFDFWEHQVIPDLQKFNLTGRESIRKMNKLLELLQCIKLEKIEFCESKDLKTMSNHKLLIVTSNVPKLLFINIHKYLQQELDDLLDTQKVFVDPSKLKNQEILRDFKALLNENPKLHIFVDCSKEVLSNLKEFDFAGEQSWVFTVVNEIQEQELENILKSSNESPVKLKIDYNWNDIEPESQNKLLETKVNFQKNSKYSLKSLLQKEDQRKIVNKNDQDNEVLDNITEIIDDQMLNCIVEKSSILINAPRKVEDNEKVFEVLFQERKLKKYTFEKYPKFRKSCLNQIRSDEFKNQVILRQLKSEHKYDITVEKVTQIELIEDIKNKKYVLVSDKAGSGKSWMLKNFTNKLKELYPTRWVTYVDLKQYIKEFKAAANQANFLNFLTKNILKLKFKYEEKIFENFYMNGKLFIFFDGFDEIAPNCAEFVTQLIESFEWNAGNQLWIATRDYFEVDLKKKLELDTVYKLDEFTEEHGVDLIASIWILSEIEIESEFQIQNKRNLLNKIKSHQKFRNYKETAEKLIEKLSMSQTNSIGLPQFYKMVADILKNRKNLCIDFTNFVLFRECVNIQYERWSKEKGEIRSKANTDSQHKELNYHKLHQLIAMYSLFPDKSKFSDMDIKSLDWSDEEIVALGLLSKMGEKFFFSHETFREYYAAEFIIRILTNREVDENFCECFIEILTNKKYEIIRIFINEALSDESTWNKIEPQIPKIAEIFCNNVEKLTTLTHIFDENLENLADFILKVFKIGSYKEVKVILFQNKELSVLATKQIKVLQKFKIFIFNYLNATDLKAYLLEHHILLKIFGSNLNINIIEGFIDELNSKMDLKFIKIALLKTDEYKENLFFYAVRSKWTNAVKFQEIFKILSRYLTASEIINLTKQSNKDNWNLLHVCFGMAEEEKLKFVWREIENFCSLNNVRDDFKRLFIKITAQEFQHPLHITVFCKSLEFHTTLWELLLETFTNREKLKKILFYKDKKGNNFIHCIIAYTNVELVVFTFKKLQENFNENQLKEILYSKGFKDRNLIQIAATYSKNIENFKFLWKFFHSYCKSDDEFKTFLSNCDFEKNNIFHLAASHSTCEILDFFFEDVEKFMSKKEIQKFLYSLNTFLNYNLLQCAAIQNLSTKTHESLWKVMHKYLSTSEIVEMIKYINILGLNVLSCAVYFNSVEIADFTWNEIKKVIVSREDQASYLKKCRFLIFNLRQMSFMREGGKTYKWYTDLAKEYALDFKACVVM